MNYENLSLETPLMERDCGYKVLGLHFNLATVSYYSDN